MSAPIVEEGKTSRTVYFPSETWFDLHTGEMHPAKSLGIIENNLTDLVPLFLRNGHIIFQQKVENITKSR
jgi:alpha-glucosidase